MFDELVRLAEEAARVLEELESEAYNRMSQHPTRDLKDIYEDARSAREVVGEKLGHLLRVVRIAR